MGSFLLKFLNLNLILFFVLFQDAGATCLAKLKPAERANLMTALAGATLSPEQQNEICDTGYNTKNWAMAVHIFYAKNPHLIPGLSDEHRRMMERLNQGVAEAQQRIGQLQHDCLQHEQCTRQQLAEIVQLKQEKQALEARRAALERDIQDKDGQLLAAEAAKQRAEAGMARLQGLLSAAQAGEQSARAELLAHKKEIEQLKGAAETLKQRIADLEQEQWELQRKLHEALRNTGDAGTQAVRLQQEIDSLLREKQALQVEVRQLDEFLNEIAAVTGTATGGDRGQRKNAIIAEIRKLQQQAQAAMAESQRLGQQLHQALSDGHAKDQDLQRYAADIEKLKANIKKLERQLAAVVQQGGTSDQQAQRVIGQLQAEVRELDGFLDEIARASSVQPGGDSRQKKEAILQNIRKLRKAAEREIAKGKTLESQVDSLTKQGYAKDSEISSLQLQIQKLQAQIEQLQAQLRQAGASGQQVVEARRIIAQLEAENDSLKDCLVRLAVAAGVKVPESGMEIKDLMAQTEGAIKGYRGQIAEMDATIRALEGRVAGLTQDNEGARRAQQQIADLTQKNQGLETTLDRLIREAQSKLATSDQGQQLSSAEIARLRKEIYTLDQQLRAANAQNERLMKLAKKVSAITGIALPERGPIDDHLIERLMTGLHTMSDNFYRESAEAKVTIERLRNDRNAKAEDIQKLTQEIRALAQQNDEITRRSQQGLQALLRDLDEARKQIATYQQELESIEAQLGSKDTLNERHKRQLEKDNQKLHQALGLAQERERQDAQTIRQLEQDLQQNSQRRIVVIYGIVDEARSKLAQIKAHLISTQKGLEMGGKPYRSLGEEIGLLTEAILELEKARPAEVQAQGHPLDIPDTSMTPVDKSLYSSGSPRTPRRTAGSRRLFGSRNQSFSEQESGGASRSYRNESDEDVYE